MLVEVPILSSGKRHRARATGTATAPTPVDACGKHYSCEGTTQGDPLAMAMYSIGILPLVDQLQSEGAKQVWFADDATAVGRVHQLRNWWTKVCNLGPSFGLLF